MLVTDGGRSLREGTPMKLSRSPNLTFSAQWYSPYCISQLFDDLEAVLNDDIKDCPFLIFNMDECLYVDVDKDIQVLFHQATSTKLLFWHAVMLLVMSSCFSLYLLVKY